MKCPKCGFVSFNHLESCRKCGKDLDGVRRERGFMDLVPQPMDISVPILMGEATDEEKTEPPVGVEDRVRGEELSLGEEAVEKGEGGDEIRLEEFPREMEGANLISEVGEEEEVRLLSEEEVGGPGSPPSDAGEETALELEDISFEEGVVSSSPETAGASGKEETPELEMESAGEGGEPAEEASSLELEELELTLEDDELEDESEETDKEDRNGGSPAGGGPSEGGPGAEDSSASFEIKMEDAEEIRGIIEAINRHMGEKQEPGAMASWREAGMGRRLLAYTVDHLLLGLLALLLTAGAVRLLVAAGDPLASPLIFLKTLRLAALSLVPWVSTLLVLYAGYYFYLVGSQGQTLGQVLFGIQVVAEDRGPVGFTRSALRLGGALLSWASFGIGFLWAALDRRHQGWPEKLSGTLVVLS